MRGISRVTRVDAWPSRSSQQPCFMGGRACGLPRLGTGPLILASRIAVMSDATERGYRSHRRGIHAFADSVWGRQRTFRTREMTDSPVGIDEARPVPRHPVSR